MMPNGDLLSRRREGRFLQEVTERTEGAFFSPHIPCIRYSRNRLRLSFPGSESSRFVCEVCLIWMVRLL